MKKAKPLTAYQKTMLLEFEEYGNKITAYGMYKDEATEIGYSSPLGNCMAYIARCAIDGKMPLNSRKWKEKDKFTAIQGDYIDYVTNGKGGGFIEGKSTFKAALCMFGFTEECPKRTSYMIYPELDKLRKQIVDRWNKACDDKKWDFRIFW